MVLLRTQLQHLGVLRRRMSRLLARNHAKAAALTRVLSRSGGRDAIAAQGAVAKVGGTYHDAASAQQRPTSYWPGGATARAGATSTTYLLEPLGKLGQLASDEAAAKLQSGDGASNSRHVAVAEGLGASGGLDRGEPHVVPADESTRLWDFPDIQKWQVIRSRRRFWPEMERMDREHAFEGQDFQWPQPTPDSSNSRPWVRTASQGIEDTPTNVFPQKFDWPQPQGGDSAFPEPAGGGRAVLGTGERAGSEARFVKAGGLLRPGDAMRLDGHRGAFVATETTLSLTHLLRPGDIMPRTRPALYWSAACSQSVCPLDTPHKERAYAWRFVA